MGVYHPARGVRLSGARIRFHRCAVNRPASFGCIVIRGPNAATICTRPPVGEIVWTLLSLTETVILVPLPVKRTSAQRDEKHLTDDSDGRYTRKSKTVGINPAAGSTLMYETPSGSHFHIKWSHKNNLDWECFDNFRDATNRAKELAGPGEQFTVQIVLTSCPMKGFKAHLSSRSERVE
jgi:hypothetical protein